MLKKISGAVMVLFLLVGLTGTSQAAKQQVNIAVVWGGAELSAFEAVAAPFEKETGIDVVIESVGRDLSTVLFTRFQAGNPPDMAAMPNPGQMREFVTQKGLAPLDPAIVSDHPAAFKNLGSVNGKLYGVFIGADLKSLIWYDPKAFKAKGYPIPTTWSDLLVLSDRIAADGAAPWAIGLKSGAASGWPGTDWIEDIMLRAAGPEVYDQWVRHDIKWTSPPVRRAWELFGRIVRNEKYVFGGTMGALSISFGDSPAALFTQSPHAYLHRQATFIQSFIKKANPSLVAGQDYDVFVFPPIDAKVGNPLLGAGDLISVFRDKPEAMQFIKYLASAKAQEIWVKKLGKLGVNARIDPAAYPDPITAKAARLLQQADAFRFDGSDLMPAAVGSGTFWSGVLDYVGGKDLDAVLERIEKSAESAYK